MGADYRQERLKSEIQRLVHQIEKGLSVEKPKNGFGYVKIKQLFKYVDQLAVSGTESNHLKKRVGDCIESYFNFHDNSGWSDKYILEFKKEFAERNFEFSSDPSYGGVLQINKTVHDPSDFDVLSRIASSRHSIRDFSREVVDIDDVIKSIAFAQYAPSACNRQSVHCYVIDNNHFQTLDFWLSNIGFFGEYGFDKILLVTSKISGYNVNEDLQHLVSPGIFVGYLILALEALNIGACIMQRSIMRDKKWTNARRILGIPEDEQSFCLIGIGKKKDSYKVPVSKRLPLEVISRIVE